MPVQISYPGVYVDELPSRSPSIMGVTTATTAFIGRAQCGPVDKPITVFSLREFEHRFQSDEEIEVADYPMVAAVHHFFLNGGSEAIIIRRFIKPELKTASANDESASASAQLIVDGIGFCADNPGSWGNEISIEIDKNGITEQVAAITQGNAISQEPSSAVQKALTKADLFNLTVLYQGRQVERFPCVTLMGNEKSAIRVDCVLKQQSSYLKIVGNLPDLVLDSAVSAQFSGGIDSGLLSNSADYLGDQLAQTGMYTLNNVDVFNLLCIPADQGTKDETLVAINPIVANFCEQKRAIFITEPLDRWTGKANKGLWSDIQVTDLGITGIASRFACTYFPKVEMSPISEKSAEPNSSEVFSSSGVIAGVMASNDMTRGVWAATAGQSAVMVGVTGLAVKMDDKCNEILNALGINCLRNFPVIGPVVWGSRTLRGADLLADDYKYLNVRRLTNYIELSLQQGIAWAAFEQNDEALWSQLRLSINEFMQGLAKQGAFYAFKVSCDATTTRVQDVMMGIVNIQVSFAPSYPDEFIVVRLQQATNGS